MKRYIWCEDSASGLQFWNAVFEVIDSKIQVQSKGNNSRLRQAAERISADENQYFILVDSAVDNADVLRELKKLHRGIEGKHNVKVINIHSFEYALLSFEFLEDWVFAREDKLRARRTDLLVARKQLIDIQEKGGDVDSLHELSESLKLARQLNTEQLSSRLLFAITRNTGFETDKSHLGECFVNDCCEWAWRQIDDMCGLDSNRKSGTEKIRHIIDYSVIKQALQKVELS